MANPCKPLALRIWLWNDKMTLGFHLLCCNQSATDGTLFSNMPPAGPLQSMGSFVSLFFIRSISMLHGESEAFQE